MPEMQHKSKGTTAMWQKP